MASSATWKRLLSILAAAVMLLSVVSFAQGEGAAYGRVNLDKVRFRKTATASVNGEWWCLLSENWVVEILDVFTQNGTDWYQVRCNIPNNLSRNYTGYLMAQYVTLMTDAERDQWLKNPVQPEGSLAYTATPGPQGAGSVTVPTAAPAQATATPAPAAGGSQPTVPAGADLNAYGRTTAENVFFRQSPGSSIYWTQLPKGWLMKITGTTVSGGVTWYKVEGAVPGDASKTLTGYLHGDYFKPLSQLPGETAAPATAVPTANVTATAPAATGVPGGETWGRVTMDKVVFRKSPSLSSDYWSYLPAGWQVKVTGSVVKNNITWYTVQGSTPTNPNASYNGYIHSGYLTLISGGGTAVPTAAPGELSGWAVVTVSAANLRQEASKTGTALTALASGALVQVISTADASWTYVRYGSLQGYVEAGSLKNLTKAEYEALTGGTVPPSAATATPTPGVPTTAPSGGVLGYIRLIKNKVNLRKTPNGSTLTPTEKEWLQKDLVLPYYREAVMSGGYGWIYVSYNGLYGYIRSDCYEKTAGPVNPTTNPAATAEPGTSGYIRLTSGGVNLRSRPSTDYSSYGRLDRDTVLPYFSVVGAGSDTWYYVYSLRYQTYGYIMGKFARPCNADGSDVTATPTPVPGTTTPTPAPSTGSYVATYVDKVYIRERPSVSSAALTQVQKANTVMSMVGAPVPSGSIVWYQVSYNGVKGYIHGRYAYQLADWQVAEYLKNGVNPTPTASPSPTPAGNSSFIMITANAVWVRSGAGTGYAPLSNTSKVNSGNVIKFTRKVQNGSTTWYRIQYNNQVGYVHGGYARVMSNAEYQQWLNGNPTATPGPTGGAAATPSVTAPPTTRTLRLGMSGDDVRTLQTALKEKGFLAADQVTGQYLSSTVDAVKAFQKSVGITVDGVAGAVTQGRLYGSSSGGNNPGSSVTVTLNPVEMVDWYTGGIQKVWAKGATAIITDVYTGISYRARRWSGAYHADVEPLTAADTAAICKIYGTSTAQEISDRDQELQSWRRRPTWVTIGGRTFAASVYGIPHNYPDGDTIPDNNYAGQFCVHFVNSRTHTGNEVDYDRPVNGNFGHQSAIKYAYQHSISGVK